MIVRWLRERRLWAVLALAILAVVVPTARAGAAVHAYDAPTVERADIHQLNTAIHQISSAGAGTRQIGDAQWPPGPQEDSASPSGADRGTSTSAASRRNATDSAPSLVESGNYVVKTPLGEYVGQSGSISQRLARHVANGKFTQAEVDAAERIAVSGGKLDREIAEQLLIDSKGGIDGLVNEVNPIGPKRFDQMPSQPYSR